MPPRARTALVALAVLAALQHPVSRAWETKGGHRGGSGYCRLFPHCTCVEGHLEYNIHCEGEVDIHYERLLVPKRVSVRCNPGAGSNTFRYLSLLRISPRDTLGIDLNLHYCPLPDSGYASLFLPRHLINSTRNLLPYSIRKLYIHCLPKRNFPLEGRHLARLDFLAVLGIYCSGLKTLDPNLLEGVSPELAEFHLEWADPRSIPPGLLSGFTSLRYLTFKAIKIRSVPEGLIDVTEVLKWFSLERNGLLELDDDVIKRVEKILTFNLSYNRLTRIPTSLCNRPELVTLYLHNNELTTLDPRCFSGFTSLLWLSVDSNRLQSLNPRLLVGATALVTFSASDNHIGMETFAYSTTGRDKNLTLNVFSEQDTRYFITPSLHKDIFVNNKVLQTLNLQRNALNSLPAKIFFNNPALTRVDLSYNKLTHISTSTFERNNKVRHLDLSNNHLSNVSDTLLANNSLLMTLNLSNNSISSLGSRLFLVSLDGRGIDLSKNHLEHLPEDIFFPFNQSQSLKSLILAWNKLRTLPPLTLPSVLDLNLAHNKLTNLTASTFKHMTSLESLNISHNLLKDIGIMIFNSGRIRSIDLSNNQFDTSTEIWMRAQQCILKEESAWSNIHSWYGMNKLNGSIPPTSLEHLDLSNNDIRSFYSFHQVAFGSNNLKEDISLRKLDLSRNRISFNDSEPTLNYGKRIWGYASRLSQLKNLEVLLLKHNEIQMIPMDWRHNLPNLQLLDLRHNRITFLWHQDLLFSNGVTASDLKTMDLSSKHFIQRGTYYQFANWHRLTVDLRHNQIMGVELPLALMADVAKGCKVDENYGHATILLGDNPFVCGCQTYQMLRYALKETRPISELEKEGNSKLVLPAKIDINGLSCWNPPTARSKMVSDPETWIHHLMPLLGLCLP